MPVRPALLFDLRERPSLVVALLAISLGAALLVAAGAGSFPLSPAQAAAVFAARIGWTLPIDHTAQQEAVLLAIRLPRVLLAALVGAALAASGAVMQAVFRNPLASPMLVGTSTGAAVGATAVIVLGTAAIGIWTLPAGAFVGGLATTLLVYRLARYRGRTEVVTLLLVGIAMNALLAAAISSLTYVSSDPQVRSIVFWTMGSVAGAQWDFVLVAGPLIVGAVAILARHVRTLDVLALGDEEARSLGIDTERMRLALITLTALATGAAVAFSGVVGFVGLVVPHTVRLVVGPGHRALLPASALGGAVLVVLADLVGRIAVSPAQLPLGLVTSFIGGPFFLGLVLRTRRQHGGWA